MIAAPKGAEVGPSGPIDKPARDEMRLQVPLEYHCETCNETFREETYEGVIKRAAAHNHLHHGGPASMTPELEAALRAQIRET